MNHFTATQLVNPGAIVYDEDRRKRYEKYQKVVEGAGFLSDREKRNWAILGSLLSDEQLEKGVQLIINEDMYRLQMRKKLEKVKPTKEQYGG